MRVVLEGTSEFIMNKINIEHKNFNKNIPILEKRGILHNPKSYLKLYGRLSRFFSHYNETLPDQYTCFYKVVIAVYLILTNYNKSLEPEVPSLK